MDIVRAIRFGLALAVVIGVWSCLPVSAGAVIHPAQTVTGPANNIVEVAGAAMASDGSGGVLYRAVAEGVEYLYVVPFDDGVFKTPIRVDAENPYGASQPAIAAGEGGRLLVVWVQPRNISRTGVTLYALESATLAPGADTFGQEIMVDANVGEPYSGNVSHVEPRLAMAPDGEAYVVYRVLADECKLGGADTGNPRNVECPPAGSDREVVEVRAARYDYLLWNSLGEINRASAIAMPDPNASNAPAIGIGEEGNGVVAWQEPSNSGEPARIWARRLFGVRQGTVLPVSPEALKGAPVSSSAEAPAVAVSRFGEAKIGFQIDGGKGSAVPTTQLYANALPSTVDPNGAKLEGAVPLPGAVASGIGPVSTSIGPSGEYRFAWRQNGVVREISGGLQGEGNVATIGAGTGAVYTTVNPSGGATTVWNAMVGGLPVVETREEFQNGAYQAASMAGGVGGPVSGLSFAGSGQGDALIAWMQGPPGDSEVVGDFVQAPPSSLIISTPEGWVTSREATVTWEPDSDAVANVNYTVYVDGRPVIRGLHGTNASLRTAALGDGVHQVQVLATDSAGQRTMSVREPLKIDANPPIVHVKLVDRRRGVRVTVIDDASGVNAKATRISFGDGAHASGKRRATHVYKRSGRYTITAEVRDNVGNHATVHIEVQVR